MAKAPVKKKKKAAKEKIDVDDALVIVDDAPKAAGNKVAVGQRFWMADKGHRRKAREVAVVSMSPGGETVTVRFVGDGKERKLPRAVFQTAGQFRLIRA